MRRDSQKLAAILEEDSGDHFGGEVCLVAALFSRQGWIILDSGAYAYDEGLIADAADDEFGVVIFPGVRAACDGFIAGGGEGRALGRALGEVRWELFGDVGH